MRTTSLRFSLFLGLTLASVGGCWWNRPPAPVAPSLKETPSKPSSMFGRTLEPLGQMGVDPRTRAIEESLGVGN